MGRLIIDCKVMRNIANSYDIHMSVGYTNKKIMTFGNHYFDVSSFEHRFCLLQTLKKRVRHSCLAKEYAMSYGSRLEEKLILSDCPGNKIKQCNHIYSKRGQRTFHKSTQNKDHLRVLKQFQQRQLNCLCENAFIKNLQYIRCPQQTRRGLE